MWLSKPVYEALPFYYLLAGAALLGASLYLDEGVWQAGCIVLGLIGLLAGLVVWLKRRDYRRRHVRGPGGPLDDEIR
ncbi:MAG: hypothetical protein JJT93_00345 [Gammaproteobacteria bacterium]|nr:hypothetical protein [Gammaproteobacteria bacterium]TVQ49299.1 MAG: hypothetical protein EA371_03235 [Gammaproteobacteria bacterium]